MPETRRSGEIPLPLVQTEFQTVVLGDIATSCTRPNILLCSPCRRSRHNGCSRTATSNDLWTLLVRIGWLVSPTLKGLYEAEEGIHRSREETGNLLKLSLREIGMHANLIWRKGVKTIKSSIMTSTLLLGCCLICGCNPSDEISEEPTTSPQHKVLIVRDEMNSTDTESSEETIGDETELSGIETGPDENGLELVYADDGSGEIVSYTWYDGHASDDCTGEPILEFRVKNESLTLSNDLFEEHPKMNSFIIRGRVGHCIDTK